MSAGIVMETMSPVVGRVRAYFAPVSQPATTAAGFTIFDPAQSGSFLLDSPPAPWIDLGWIAGFARRCGTKVEAIRTGAPATVQMHARTEIDATVSFEFESWGKLQLALSAGVQQMNLLDVAPGSAAAGSGGVAVPAVALQTVAVTGGHPGGIGGPTGSVLEVGVTAAGSFSVGELVAVDVDYVGQTGYIGGGVSGAFVQTALSDVDYVRRVTLNVGRIASISGGALTLETALIAGVNAATMKVSGVAGFCDREGSSFFQEWSAVFVGEGQQGERVIWHYPRLQAMQGVFEASAASPGGYDKVRLGGAFRALPVKDPVDGETVVCFRSYMAG